MIKHTIKNLASCPLAWLLAMTLVLGACRAELYHGLGEDEANEAVAVLDEQGIEAHKEADPGSDLWMLTVAPNQRAQAWRAMQEAGLPRRSSSGVETIFPRSGLLPSPAEERALLQAATAGDLERSLQSIPGVLDARVHLVMPAPGRLQPPGSPLPSASASVLIKTRPEATLKTSEITALLIGAVPALEPDAVRVVITQAATPSAAQNTAATVPVGPFEVAVGSAQALKWTLSGLLLSILVLCGVALAMTLGHRRRRLQTAQNLQAAQNQP